MTISHIQELTHKAYQTLREAIGSQVAVAKYLGISLSTLQRRENGRKPIPLADRFIMIVLNELGFKLRKNRPKRNDK